MSERFRQLTRLALFFVPVWLMLVLDPWIHLVPKSMITPALWDILISLPLYLLITFGCYSLATVGYHVYCVRSDDRASESLIKEIAEAKQDLRKKGFKFDEAKAKTKG